MLYNGAYLCFYGELWMLKNRSPAWFAQELHHRPSKIYRFSRINHLRVAYLIHCLEKQRRSLWCRNGRVEANAVTMCHRKLNCWPINSVYRFNLKVPARQINAKHTLHLLLRTVKISANKIIYWLYRNLKYVHEDACCNRSKDSTQKG